MDYSSKLVFLERILGKSKYSMSTKEAEFFSPFCNHRKRKLSINLETDRWQCWISGKNGKKLLYVIRESDGSKSDIQEYLQKYKAKDVVVTANTNIEAAHRVEFPEHYKPLVMCKNSAIGRRAYKYLMNRGISEIDILRHKIGIVLGGNYAGRILFPSFSSRGMLNLFAARGYDGSYFTSDVPRGYKNTIILNEINIDWTKPVVIVEGFVDMLKSVPNTIPLFGSSVHFESLLFEKIVENNTKVILAFDPDAQKKSNTLAKKFTRFDIDVYTVDLGSHEDVGAMSKKEFLSAYEARLLWTPENSFRERLRNLC